MADKDTLKRIITEWYEFTAVGLFQRDFDNSLLFNNQILTIIGPRRAGKTCLCYQIINRLKSEVPEDNILFINMEDERLYPLSGNELTDLLPTYYELYSPDQKQKIYVIIDEIQNILYWSKWCRRVTEQNKNIKLIITGSTSNLLSSELSTELRGRALSFVVYPSSFREYLGFRNQNIETKKILYSSKRPQIKKLFNDFFNCGGFPEIINSKNCKHLLQEYYRTIFYRDLIERYSVKNVRLFEDFLKLQITEFSSLSSVTQMAKKCEALGHKLSKNTINHYFHYAQEAFLLFTTSIFSYKIKNQLLFPKKVYAVDHGLIQAIRFSFSEDYGRYLENIVFIELLRRGNEVYYYQNKVECDFLIKERNKIVQAIQVTKSINNTKTRERELRGLISAINEFGLTKGLILTDDEYDEINYDGKTITVTPVWFWLLA